jgi:hypothetical protein
MRHNICNPIREAIAEQRGVISEMAEQCFAWLHEKLTCGRGCLGQRALSGRLQLVALLSGQRDQRRGIGQACAAPAELLDEQR